MKRIMLMLFAMAFIVSIAYAELDGFAGPSDQKAFDGKWDDGKCFETDHGHSGPCMGPCTEICPGYKHHDHDKCGCNHGCEEQCDCAQKHSHNDNCFVFEKCDECGKMVCDGICKECHKRCDVYEYCVKCNTRYSVCHADGICDKCGRDCYCIEKCTKCGWNWYFNGYCDECANKCYYTRCCPALDHAGPAPCGDKCTEKCDSCMGEKSCDDAGPTVMAIYMGEVDSADAAPGMEMGTPEADGIIPLNYPPEDKAPVDEAPVDEAPTDEI